MWYQKDIDRQFNINEINPIVKMVESYKAKNGSYPTLEQFNSIILGSKFENRITEYKSNSNSFYFSIWRGEWDESYSSMGEAYSTGQVHIVAHLIYSSVAIISLVILLRKKKLSQQENVCLNKP